MLRLEIVQASPPGQIQFRRIHVADALAALPIYYPADKSQNTVSASFWSSNI
jgi:hypothetical protein